MKLFAMCVNIGIADLPNAAVLLGTGLKWYFLLLVCISDSGWIQNQKAIDMSMCIHRYGSR